MLAGTGGSPWHDRAILPPFRSSGAYVIAAHAGSKLLARMGRRLPGRRLALRNGAFTDEWTEGPDRPRHVMESLTMLIEHRGCRKVEQSGGWKPITSAPFPRRTANAGRSSSYAGCRVEGGLGSWRRAVLSADFGRAGSVLVMNCTRLRYRWARTHAILTGKTLQLTD